MRKRYEIGTKVTTKTTPSRIEEVTHHHYDDSHGWIHSLTISNGGFTYNFLRQYRGKNIVGGIILIDGLEIESKNGLGESKC